MRSMFGVLTKGCPVQLSASHRKSSRSTKTMFGRGSAFSAAEATALTAKAANRAIIVDRSIADFICESEKLRDDFQCCGPSISMLSSFLPGFTVYFNPDLSKPRNRGATVGLGHRGCPPS